MGWLASDDFDSYSAGSNLGGQGGAVNGWSGNWTTMSGADWTAEAAPSGGQGGNAARANGNVTNSKIRRELTTYLANGTLQWRMRINRTDPNAFTALVLASDPSNNTGYCSISFGANGQIQIFHDTSGFQDLGAYAADTWYTITLEFNTTQYRAKIDSGAYSAFVPVDNGPLVTVGEVIMWCSATNATTFYIDDIRAPDEVAPTSRIQLAPVRSGHRFR